MTNLFFERYYNVKRSVIVVSFAKIMIFFNFDGKDWLNKKVGISKI
jgi:hypothetical protein